MKKLAIYEPAMCCDTGICGVSVDPELLRISAVINNLKKNGIAVERYNLTNAPMAFVELVDRPEQTEAVEVEESAGE